MAEARKAADAVFNELGITIMEGSKVTIPNFGNFDIRTTKPRVINDLAGGGVKRTTSRDKPVFRPSKSLIDKLNQVKGGARV
jgi:nucleoid DNA-binding protein